MKQFGWETVGLLALVLAVGGALLLAFQVLTLRAVRWLLRKDVARLCAGRRIARQALTANFFGQESQGRGQARGNGALLLAERELLFVLAAPRREIAIPLPQVTEVGLARSHLGKSILRPLLRVAWRGPEGTDAAAWSVPDVTGWVRDIEAARRQAGPGPGPHQQP